MTLHIPTVAQLSELEIAPRALAHSFRQLGRNAVEH
jgi:hypothetical protein